MRVVLGAALSVVTAVGIIGIVMQPSPAEQLAIGLIFALMAASTVAAAFWLPKLAKGNRSLRTTFMTLSVISFLIVVFGLLAAGQQMFISTHDLTLLLIVMGFGVVAAVSFALLVSGPLTEELTKMAATASAIAEGDLTQRTAIGRSDEVGELSMAIDEMATVLQEAALVRVRDDEARREFFSAVGHDLRTPLASLRVAIEAVQDGMTDDPERYLDSMQRDTEALTTLVDDLFLLARLESGDVNHDIGPVDLTEVADEAVEVFRPLLDERGLTARVEMDQRVTAVASSEGMARVVRNLLDNAVRHSPEGGEIVVSISNGDWALVRIGDDGEGFSSGFVDQAFDRLSRDGGDRNRSEGGAGLGLAIAQRYIDDFGGRIWADPGPGGTVSFVLPISSTPSRS